MRLTIDTAGAMCIDGEIASSEDKPRSLVLMETSKLPINSKTRKIVLKRVKADLDEDDAICIVRVEPIFDIWLELNRRVTQDISDTLRH